MKNMKIYDTIVKSEPITKGFSGDKKYCVTACDGIKYLLRVMPIEKHDMWQNLFAMLEYLVSLGVPMSKPVEFGVCDDGVYVLFSWIDGEELEAALPGLSAAEQYKLGAKAGKILRLINSIPAPETEEEWAVKYNRKIDEKLKKYYECKINKINGDEYCVKYIERNRELIENRPQCFVHDDYNTYNMMFENGELRIIDFDRYKFGDPWEEFFKTIFSARISPHFTTGQLHGYFDGEPPIEFFKLMAFYTSVRIIGAADWAVQHGQEEVDFVKKLCADTLKWHDNMQNPVPAWYLEEWRAAKC